MTKAQQQAIRRRLQNYSNLGIDLNLVARNINMSPTAIWELAEQHGWLDELCDMFALGDKCPEFECSAHEGIRRLQLDELDALAPQLHRRLMVRALTRNWDKKSIKKEVLFNGQQRLNRANKAGQKPDRHA